MKKLILVIVFVFATGTSFLNASNISEELEVVERDCIGFAFAIEGIIGHEMTYEQFSNVVDSCEALQ